MKSYSVLMSVYAKEQPQFLKLAIESILNQTVSTNEFVIVCDGPLTQALDAAHTKEEKATIFYSYFTSKKASKADFAQMLALKLSQKFKDKPDLLKGVIPSYLSDAIDYVIG